MPNQSGRQTVGNRERVLRRRGLVGSDSTQMLREVVPRRDKPSQFGRRAAIRNVIDGSLRFFDGFLPRCVGRQGAHHKAGARPLAGGPLKLGVAARDELIETAAQDTCSGLERHAAAVPPLCDGFLGFGQHRHKAVAGRASDRLPRRQQRRECDLRRRRAGHRRALCRLLRRTAAHPRVHLDGQRRCGHGRSRCLIFIPGHSFSAWRLWWAYFSLHRLCFVRETAGITAKLLVRDLLLDACRSIQSLSSAAGLPRVVLPQLWLVLPRSGKPPAIDRVGD
jgi:hypothetical protein